ncbi:MAG TPA: cation-binding protein [Chloroflexi bacterium]|nr:cation-binding protein [Chloroflexota bacterium]
MMPIGPLMKEHRLIERMIALMEKEIDRIEEGEGLDVHFIDVAVDFIRTYADRCHHGKEEDILFRELAKKALTPEHSQTMRDLIAEHVYGRETTAALAAAKERHVQGDRQAVGSVIGYLKDLVEFYPAHIEKEDKHFFVPCMEYLTRQEQDEMLEEFWEFDRGLIHEKYRRTVEQME